ncbi:MAG: hypothetical protein JWQ40_5037 [Segetibacter sp.]|jgi:hypothetical protein|nr:hypothetical protein [Segetibacter sp.]
MKTFTFLFFLCCVSQSSSLNGQAFFNGKFRIAGYSHNGYTYTLYDFSREANIMKAKYFAQNAFSQYQNWKNGKQILLVTAGAFSDSFDPTGKPVGLCVDNGTIVTRNPDANMDGMVIVYNGSAQQGGVVVVDMDVKPVRVESTYQTGIYNTYYPRSSATDRVNFLNWGERNGVTLFQTQLVYSSDRTSHFNNLYFGNRRERRFLAICRKNNIVHHVVIDTPSADKLELNLSASYAKAVLDYDGFNVLYIMNLDRGAKDILYGYNGFLRDLKPNPDARIEDATNLLVYYKD